MKKVLKEVSDLGIKMSGTVGMVKIVLSCMHVLNATIVNVLICIQKCASTSYLEDNARFIQIVHMSMTIQV